MIGLVSGYLVFWLISKYYFHVCPACSASHFDEQTTKRFSEIVLLMVTALSFHSLFDGIALTTGGGHMHFESNSIFFAILVHKFPEGLALASLMLGAAYSKKKIITYVTLVELTTVLGAVIGAFLLQSMISPTVFGMIMAHIGGGFIFLAFHAVLGEMLKNHTKLVVTSFIIGCLLIVATRLIAGSI
ncbi:MAG: ZIP family metal transporter [Bacillota bacterium]